MRNLKLTSHRETDLNLCSSSASGDSDSGVFAGFGSFLSLDFDAGLVFVARGRRIVAVGLDDGGGGGGGGGTVPADGKDDVDDGGGASVRWRLELKLKDEDVIVGLHWSLENEALVVATKG